MSGKTAGVFEVCVEPVNEPVEACLECGVLFADLFFPGRGEPFGDGPPGSSAFFGFGDDAGFFESAGGEPVLSQGEVGAFDDDFQVVDFTVEGECGEPGEGGADRREVFDRDVFAGGEPERMPCSTRKDAEVGDEFVEEGQSGREGGRKESDVFWPDA